MKITKIPSHLASIRAMYESTEISLSRLLRQAPPSMLTQYSDSDAFFSSPLANHACRLQKRDYKYQKYARVEKSMVVPNRGQIKLKYNLPKFTYRVLYVALPSIP